jgi:hypothetical protein
MTFGPNFLYVEALRQRAQQGRFAGLLAIHLDDGEWLVTLGGRNSDATRHGRGKTFEAAAQEVLLQR